MAQSATHVVSHTAQSTCTVVAHATWFENRRSIDMGTEENLRLPLSPL